MPLAPGEKHYLVMRLLFPEKQLLRLCAARTALAVEWENDWIDGDASRCCYCHVNRHYCNQQKEKHQRFSRRPNPLG